MTSSSKNALMVFTGSGVKSVRSDNKIENRHLKDILKLTDLESQATRWSIAKNPKSKIPLLSYKSLIFSKKSFFLENCLRTGNWDQYTLSTCFQQFQYS